MADFHYDDRLEQCARMMQRLADLLVEQRAMNGRMEGDMAGMEGDIAEQVQSNQRLETLLTRLKEARQNGREA